MKQTKWYLFLVILLVFLIPASVCAHKIDTHVWIAQQVLNDVLPDGKLTIGGKEFLIDPELHNILWNCQDEYRAGALGPDAFPDMVGGQMTVHPGVPGDDTRWQTSDWLDYVLNVGTSSGNCAEAFAFGYLTHAAGDIFAHTYINIYAGDIFDLTDDQEEELRHMALEAYVSKHMPPILDYQGTEMQAYEIIQVPEEFFTPLILNPNVAEEYRALPATRYLAAMYDLWAKLNELINDAEVLSDRITQDISKIEVCLVKIPNPWPIPDIDLGCVDLDPIYDLVCIDCDRYDVCDVADWIPGCSYLSACLLVPTDPVGCTTREILSHSGQILADSITLPLRQWRNAVEEAIRQYALTQEEMAAEIMRGDDGDPMGAFTRWLTCWGPAFSGAIPVEISGTCDTSLNVFHTITDGVASFRTWVSDHTGKLGWALDPAQKFSEDIKPRLYEGLLDGLDALTTEGSVLDSLVLMRRTEHNDDTLNEEFSENSSSKELLEIPDIAQRVRAEMNIDPNTDQFSPNDYPVIYNSIVISKLLLLPASEINRMVSEAGIDTTAYGPTLYQDVIPFSAVLGTPRSIDGSHQWQEFSPPYARTCNLGELDEEGLLECIQKDNSFSEDRNYGYSFAEPEGGFRLWQDCNVREKVFKNIFIGPLAPGLEIATELGFGELLPLNHPLRGSLEDPFPMSSASANIDTIPPVPDTVELPMVITSCNEPALIGDPPTATDGCQGTITGITADPLSYSSAGLQRITWTYQDDAGNESFQDQLINVKDLTPPSLTPPPSVSVEQTSLDGTPVTLGMATVTDNCDGEVTLINDAPDIFPLGETIVTYTAVDASGNTTQKQVTLNVLDTTPPALTDIPPDVTLEQESLDGTAYDVGMPQVSDICDAEPQLTSNALDIYPLGTTEVVFRATDDSGNVATASTWVTVEDTTPPVLESITPSREYLWPPTHKMRRVDITAVATDICDSNPRCQVTSVESNQPINSTADGDTEIDWQIIGDLRVKLLAERAGNDFSEPRIYTITVQCNDTSGNSSNLMSTTVVVPVEIEDLDI